MTTENIRALVQYRLEQAEETLRASRLRRLARDFAPQHNPFRHIEPHALGVHVFAQPGTYDRDTQTVIVGEQETAPEPTARLRVEINGFV